MKIEADNQNRTAADPLSGVLIKIRADVRSNLSQVGRHPARGHRNTAFHPGAEQRRWRPRSHHLATRCRAHVRALGVGIGYALANSLFDGTAPLIYQALKTDGQVPQFIAYVTVCIAVSLVVYVFFLKNRSDTYLDRERGPAFQR